MIVGTLTGAWAVSYSLDPKKSDFFLSSYELPVVLPARLGLDSTFLSMRIFTDSFFAGNHSYFL